MAKSRLTAACGQVMLRFGKYIGRRLKDIPLEALVRLRKWEDIWPETKKSIEDWIRFLMEHPDWVPCNVFKKKKLQNDRWIEEPKLLGELKIGQLEWLVHDFQWKEEYAATRWMAEAELLDRIKSERLLTGRPAVDTPLERVKGFCPAEMIKVPDLVVATKTMVQTGGSVGVYQYRMVERTLVTTKGKPSGWNVSNPGVDTTGDITWEWRLVKVTPGKGRHMMLVKVDGEWKTWKRFAVRQLPYDEGKAFQERKRCWTTTPVKKGDPWPKLLGTEKDKQEVMRADKIVQLWDAIWMAGKQELQDINDKICWMVNHNMMNFTVELMLREEIERRWEEVLFKEEHKAAERRNQYGQMVQLDVKRLADRKSRKYL